MAEIARTLSTMVEENLDICNSEVAEMHSRGPQVILYPLRARIFPARPTPMFYTPIDRSR